MRIECFEHFECFEFLALGAFASGLGLNAFESFNSQYFFSKISWIGPWVSRFIDAKGIDVAQPIWQ